MEYPFDMEKAVAASGYLVSKAGGSIDVFLLLKTLYLADRFAISEGKMPVVGDRYVSMDKGPVLSRVYDCIKGKGDSRELEIWRTFFTERENHQIKCRQVVDVDRLSEWDQELLAKAFEITSSMPPYMLASWTHNVFPEWEDPKGSSIPIDPKQILRLAKKSEQEIQNIEDEVESMRLLKLLAG
jgi:uncharacterized phage-associated protein